MTRAFRFILLTLLLGLALAPLCAQTGTIEEIEVQGLFRMTRAGFLNALGVGPGDPYDPDVLRRKFRDLWDMALFEDIRISAERGAAGGTVLVIQVVERPVLTSVTFQENKVVNRTQIEDAFREQELDLNLGRPLDPKKIADAEALIRDLLGQKGFLDSEVSHSIETVTETSRAVTFNIRPGAKTRIKKITFVGNEVFKSKALRRQLELTEEWKWYWPWSRKNLYHPIKWDQDSGRIRDLYRSVGYLDINLRAPVVEIRKVKPKKKKKEIRVEVPPLIRQALADVEQKLDRDDVQGKKRKKLRARKSRLEKMAEKKLKKLEMKANASDRQWVHLTVKVEEGKQYRLGDVSITGNTVFGDELLRRDVFLREGSVLSETLVKAGVDRITRRYEDRGHLYASVIRRIDRREGDEPVADLSLTINEDDPYTVARIDFNGNTSTHDKVLRRELVVKEGELFNRTRLLLSQRKLNQLGYFTVSEEPIIEPIEGTDTVRIRFEGEEQGRNEIQVGGGYSGLDGAFFNGVYSTRNFLGRGQILSAALQVGGRSSRYQLSFTEPWFLSRPITFGFSLFRRDVDFGGSFTSSSQGLGMVLGRRVGNFSFASLNYNYESVSSSALAIVGADPSTFSRAENTISSITPNFVYNTVNNPYRPSRGKRFAASFQTAGGPLGGDTSFLKPILQWTGYRKATRRSFFGFNAQLGYVTAWDDGSPNNSATINDIPRFQRFWLGGDQQGPRIFETRTITPRRYVELDDDNNILRVLGDPRNVPVADLVNAGAVPVLVEVGGDRFYLFQTEFVYQLNQQAELAFFVDAGDALFEDTSFDFRTARVSAGVELRFHLPVFPVPLRLIYGTAIRKLDTDDTSTFQFSIGRSF